MTVFILFRMIWRCLPCYLLSERISVRYYAYFYFASLSILRLFQTSRADLLILAEGGM